MKISEMNNDQAAECLIRIAEPVSNLCDDEDLVTMLDEFSKMNDLGIVRAIGRMLPKLVTYVLKKHKKDFYEIIGALDGRPTREVAQMPFMDTVKLVQDSYDDVLRDFFTRSAAAGKATDVLSPA